MNVHKYTAFKYSKPFVIVLLSVLIILTVSPALSWSRSKRFNDTIRSYGTQTYNNEHPQKDREYFEYRNNRIFHPSTDRGRRFPLQTKNYRKGYRNLSPEQKRMLKRRYQEWQSMPEKRQEILRRRMQRWEQLPPQERELLQRRFQRWQKLSPDEREQIREKLQEWDLLSPGEKEQILRRFRNP